MNVTAKHLDYFLPDQVKWITCDEQIALWEKSRRIGASYVEAYRSVERRVRLKTHHYFSSADLTAAKEFIDYCAMWAKVFNVVAKNLGEVVIDEADGVKAFVLEFENGARVVAGSSNPKFFRSKGGDATLDEFAFHQHGWELYKAAYATAILWGHQLRIMSTHNGEGSYFNALVGLGRKYMEAKAAPEGGKLDDFTGPRIHVQTTTFRQAVDQGLAEKVAGVRVPKAGEPLDEATIVRRATYIKSVESGYTDQAQRDEELGCLPNSDHSAYLSYELIRAAETDNLKLLADVAELSGTNYAGFDVGRRHDLSVLWVCEKVGDTYATRMLRVLDRQSFAVQAGVLNALMQNRAVKRLCIDETGLGMQLAEQAKERWGSRVEGVTLSGPTKAALGAAFKDLFEDRRIRIPKQVDWDAPTMPGLIGAVERGMKLNRGRREDWLREDLHKTRKTTTAAGNVRLVAEDNVDGHADAFWAGALMREAADETKVPLHKPLAEKPAGF